MKLSDVMRVGFPIARDHAIQMFECRSAWRLPADARDLEIAQ